MAFEIVWTKRATKGFDNIVKHLENNWSDKEVSRFIRDSDKFFKTLSIHPEILERSHKKDLYRGPINKLTILTYRVNFIKKQIEIINIRSARKQPLK